MLNPAPNPLFELHERANAEFQAYGDLEIVSTFGQPPLEYSALHKSCGLMDQAHRAILELTGPDRLDFLNRLITNQTWDKEKKTGLAAGHGVYSFFLNGKGRVVADMNVLELGDRTWLEMDARLIESTRTGLEKYLFAEKAKFASRLDSLHEFALHGPGAITLINAIAPAPLPDLQPLASAPTSLLGVETIIWRDDIGGHHAVLPTDRAAEVWSALLQKFSPPDQPHVPLRTVGWAAYNSTRIEGGRPLYGIDFDDTILPAETGLMDRAVSLTKGCYLGQEIVARMHARAQVARQIVGFRMEGDYLPLAGAQIFDDQSNAVGGVTSSTMSPILSDAAIGLALVKKPFFAIGTKLQIPAEGAMRKATIVALPFINK